MDELPVLGLRNSLPTESPLTYFPQCLKDFEEDLLKVRIDAHDIYTLFNLKWTKNEHQENVINFEFQLLNMELHERDETHIFYIELSVVKERSFWCREVEKTKVVMKMTRMKKGVAEPTKNYGEDLFFGRCEENAAKLLIHYGMITGSIMNDIHVDLPPIPTIFPARKSWTPRKFEITVHPSIENKLFVGQWLQFIPTRAGVKMTINSPHHPVALKDDAKFEEFMCSVAELTINAKSDIDMKFIIKYDYMSKIVYNDPAGVSPLTLEECVKYWANHVNSFRKIHIRLICRHDPSKLAGALVEALTLACPDGIYNEETKTIELDAEDRRTRKFSVSEDELVIHINN